MNREHCLFEADRCVTVSPSDTAPALIALDAKFVIRHSKGQRVIDATRKIISSVRRWVNVALAMIVEAGTIKQARIVVGGIAARPFRLKPVEDSLRGERLGEETAELAGQTATWGAKPLNHNHYKVLLMKNLVKRSVRGIKI